MSGCPDCETYEKVISDLEDQISRYRAEANPCPSCGEPNDPERDCGFFSCTACSKMICECCAVSGMCSDCEMDNY